MLAVLWYPDRERERTLALTQLLTGDLPWNTEYSGSQWLLPAIKNKTLGCRDQQNVPQSNRHRGKRPRMSGSDSNPKTPHYLAIVRRYLLCPSIRHPRGELGHHFSKGSKAFGSVLFLYICMLGKATYDHGNRPHHVLDYLVGQNEGTG